MFVGGQIGSLVGGMGLGTIGGLIGGGSCRPYGPNRCVWLAPSESA